MEKIKLEKLHANAWNPNRMTDGKFQELVREIEHLGRVAKPIVVRQNEDGYEIVDGEHTYKALLELDYQEIPPDWVEVIKAGDFEAMRQTYKRNQHGTHDPVLEGKLFKRMMENEGLSQRALAEKIGVSEGKVRISLGYVEAAEKVRIQYAVGDLTNEQMRIYNKIPQPFADAWLGLDCSEAALFWNLREGYWKEFDIDHARREMEYYEKENPDRGSGNYFIPEMQMLKDVGIASYFRPGSNWSVQNFISHMRKLWDYYLLVNRFARGNLDLFRQAERYTFHYWKNAWPVRDEHFMTDAMRQLMYKDENDEYQFLCSPDTFTAWIETCDSAYELTFLLKDQRRKIVEGENSMPADLELLIERVRTTADDYIVDALEASIEDKENWGYWRGKVETLKDLQSVKLPDMQKEAEAAKRAIADIIALDDSRYSVGLEDIVDLVKSIAERAVWMKEQNERMANKTDHDLRQDIISYYDWTGSANEKLKQFTRDELIQIEYGAGAWNNRQRMNEEIKAFAAAFGNQAVIRENKKKKEMAKQACKILEGYKPTGSKRKSRW